MIGRSVGRPDHGLWIAALIQPCRRSKTIEVLRLRVGGPSRDLQGLGIWKMIDERRQDAPYLRTNTSPIEIELPDRVPGGRLAGDPEQGPTLGPLGQGLPGDAQHLAHRRCVEALSYCLGPPRRTAQLIGGIVSKLRPRLGWEACQLTLGQLGDPLAETFDDLPLCQFGPSGTSS